MDDVISPKVSPPKRDSLTLICDVADRAKAEGFVGKGKLYPDHLTLLMDIECVLETTPLRLREWAKADRFNFTHDLCGIARHLNRRSRKLEDCFVPRFFSARAAQHFASLAARKKGRKEVNKS